LKLLGNRRGGKGVLSTLMRGGKRFEVDGGGERGKEQRLPLALKREKTQEKRRRKRRKGTPSILFPNTRKCMGKKKKKKKTGKGRKRRGEGGGGRGGASKTYWTFFWIRLIREGGEKTRRAGRGGRREGE